MPGRLLAFRYKRNGLVARICLSDRLRTALGDGVLVRITCCRARTLVLRSYRRERDFRADVSLERGHKSL